MAVRDRDINATGGWDGAADGTMEEQRFYLQNWRADVVGLMRPDGVLPGWFKYSAYGKHHEVLLVDVDDGTSTGTRDGGVTIDDYLYYYGQFEEGVPEADMTNDGGVTIEDLLLYLELYEAGGPTTQSRIMYAGYQYDAKVDLYHVRFRVYSTELGSWLTQDPLGYIDSVNLCEYVTSGPALAIDPFGLEGTPRLTVPDAIAPPKDTDSQLGPKSNPVPRVIPSQISIDIGEALRRALRPKKMGDNPVTIITDDTAPADRNGFKRVDKKLAGKVYYDITSNSLAAVLRKYTSEAGGCITNLNLVGHGSSGCGVVSSTGSINELSSNELAMSIQYYTCDNARINIFGCNAAEDPLAHQKMADLLNREVCACTGTTRGIVCDGDYVCKKPNTQSINSNDCKK